MPRIKERIEQTSTFPASKRNKTPETPAPFECLKFRVSLSSPMPYQTATYNILIASPGDIRKERAVARQAIIDWNAAHSESLGVVLRPIDWEMDSYPKLGDRPQALLNRQLVERADVLMAIFRARVGSSTGVMKCACYRFGSGAAGECF
jgi:hypothetical protein